MLIKNDGGPNHAIRTLHNKVGIFSMLLVIRVDKLILIRSLPGLLCLNKVDRTITVLNIELANLALQMKP